MIRCSCRGRGFVRASGWDEVEGGVGVRLGVRLLGLDLRIDFGGEVGRVCRVGGVAMRI